MKLDWSNYEAEADAATTPEKCFMAAALGGRNCFLTGMAGTGKSTLLRQFIEASPRAVDVTAPTGVAALNVGGMTLHRFCGMRLGPQAGERNAEYYQKLLDEHHPAITAAFKRVRECRVLVIDEISMLPGRLLDFVDFLFREERDCKEPFGGCQIIATGDFLQLPPVRTSEIAPYDWAFLSQAWKNAEFKTDILETVRRQDEPEFVRALADFRLGKVWGQTARILQSRIRSFPPSNLTRLFTHNVQVDKWNAIQLDSLPGEPVALEAQTEGPDLQVDFLKKNLTTPSTLVLKPGALVMFTINRSAPGNVKDGEYIPGPVLHVNGELGVVETLDRQREVISVRNNRGHVIYATPFTWLFNRKDPEGGKLRQYPLRLAYALTMHKAQGLTLDAAYLDIRAAREPGQAYVAVSRVRTLAGLNLKAWFKGVHVSPQALAFYQRN